MTQPMQMTPEVREALDAHGDLLSFMASETAPLAHPAMERAANALLDAATRLEAMERLLGLRQTTSRLGPDVDGLIEACRLTMQWIERHDADAGVHGRALARIRFALRTRQAEITGEIKPETVDKLVAACRAARHSFARFPGSLYDEPCDAIAKALRRFSERDRGRPYQTRRDCRPPRSRPDTSEGAEPGSRRPAVSP